MQKITLIGNIGQDAKLVNCQGSEFLDISVAVTETRGKGEQKTEKTTWYDVNTDAVKLAPFLKKGTKIYVEGNFKLDTFFSDKIQKWIPKIIIYARQIELLSAKKEDEQSN